MPDDEPTPDVIDQRHPVRPDDTGDEAALDIDIEDGGAALPVEADPADVVDQHRVAPVIDEHEPWP